MTLQSHDPMVGSRNSSPLSDVPFSLNMVVCVSRQTEISFYDVTVTYVTGSHPFSVKTWVMSFKSSIVVANRFSDDSIRLHKLLCVNTYA